MQYYDKFGTYYLHSILKFYNIPSPYEFICNKKYLTSKIITDMREV